MDPVTRWFQLLPHECIVGAAQFCDMIGATADSGTRGASAYKVCGTLWRHGMMPDGASVYVRVR